MGRIHLWNFGWEYHFKEYSRRHSLGYVQKLTTRVIFFERELLIAVRICLLELSTTINVVKLQKELLLPLEFHWFLKFVINEQPWPLLRAHHTTHLNGATFQNLLCVTWKVDHSFSCHLRVSVPVPFPSRGAKTRSKPKATSTTSQQTNGKTRVKPQTGRLSAI